MSHHVGDVVAEGTCWPSLVAASSVAQLTFRIKKSCEHEPKGICVSRSLCPPLGCFWTPSSTLASSDITALTVGLTLFEQKHMGRTAFSNFILKHFKR